MRKFHNSTKYSVSEGEKFKKVIHSQIFSVENAFSSPKTVDKCPGNAYNCIVLERSVVAFPLSERVFR